MYFNIPAISQAPKKNIMKYYSGIIFSMYSREDNYNNESVFFIITALLCIASLKTIRVFPHGKDLELTLLAMVSWNIQCTFS